MGEYSLMVWDRLPLDKEIVPHMRSNPIEDSVWSQMGTSYRSIVPIPCDVLLMMPLLSCRAVFTAHGMTDKFTLSLLHRHFQMAANERLVEDNDVASPWDIHASSVAPLASRVYPQSWTFVHHKLYPYEFGFEADNAVSMPFCEMSEAFVRDLEDVLLKHGLTRTFGLGLAKRTERPSGGSVKAMELTTGRTSIVIPMAPEQKVDNVIEAQCRFPAKGDPKAPEPVRMRVRCCNFHDLPL